MNETALVLRDVSKRFGEVIAIDRLDLEVFAGELLTLVGPSGSGKSTALHMITGMIHPDRGELRLFDQDLIDMAPGKRDVAMVWQDGALYPHLTVMQNLAFPLKARGKRGMKAVQHMAVRLDIANLLDRRPAQISGGERQRVALGRALIRKPKLFLLDEPLSSLDPPSRERLRNLIRELIQETGVTTLYVTHDQGEAMAMGDRVAVMDKGRIVQIGTPQQIYCEPIHAFVAGFFGTPPMNLLPGRIETGQAVGEWGRLDVDCAVKAASAHIGFRPENVLLSETETALPARLASLVYQGHETIAVFDAAGAEIRMRAGEKRKLPAVGEVAYLRVDSQKLYLFAADSGERL
jgi:multiple sugar transport system ATP-binding protein